MTAEYGLRTTTQSYWLNHMELSPGDHYTYGIQYRAPRRSPSTGGSTVTLFVHDPDDFMNTNHMDSLPEEAPPALQARLDVIRGQRLMGQFVYVEVVAGAGDHDGDRPEIAARAGCWPPPAPARRRR